jgi:hypothetical protein
MLLRDGWTQLSPQVPQAVLRDLERRRLIEVGYSLGYTFQHRYARIRRAS